MTDTYTAALKKMEYQRLTADINEEINIEHLKTMYYGFEGTREVEIRFIDPRGFTVEQRKFIYALLGDIFAFTGEPVDSLKIYFWAKFEAVAGRKISLADVSSATVEDAGLLADIIIDFIFEWDIPFKKGYEILPVNQEYYFYKCLVSRKCCICGKPADICHVDTVGMGRNRRKINHSDFSFYAGCRDHHQEEHRIGTQNFLNKYQIKPQKLNDETRKRLNIGG